MKVLPGPPKFMGSRLIVKTLLERGLSSQTLEVMEAHNFPAYHISVMMNGYRRSLKAIDAGSIPATEAKCGII